MQRLLIASCLCLSAAAGEHNVSSNLRGSSASGKQCTEVGHDPKQNQVTFDGVDSVSFSMESYTVTSGQAVSANCVSTSGNVLTFAADRSKSKEVSAAFMAGLTLGPVNVMPSKCAAEFSVHLCPSPRELNFQMQGTMTFTISGKEYTCREFRIGQGSYKQGFEGHNNWWVGSGRCEGTTATLGQTLNCNMPVVGCGLSFTYTGIADKFQVSVATR
jgi:hypothetical protein